MGGDRGGGERVTAQVLRIECDHCDRASRALLAYPGATEAETATRLREMILAAIGDGWRAVGRSMRCPLCVARYGVTRRRRGS